MTIVKWAVSIYGDKPERKEYDRETLHFYIFTSGSAKVPRRDHKSSLYRRYFNSESEALAYIHDRAESKADQKRTDRINRHGVELLSALESLVLFTSPKPSNAAALNNARQVISKARGEG